MKLFFFALILSTSYNLQADEAKVEITSFRYAGAPTRIAEICGKIVNFNGPSATIKIVVDPNMNRPGIYNVLVGSEAQFCTVVLTYTGKASVQLWPGNGKTSEFKVNKIDAVDESQTDQL